ncbi:response regulator [Candidatus Magnetaquicoccus inordinatus]|uniref:response regulator n=1 Tax=Candidatus Magnetaquicoccus inordinatus TaxID=2496818 RepID=UPI00102B002D|nr:response regulator [Candidatus Magnetaquicoccus inordinatus]
MRILVVDDEPHNRMLLQHMLKSFGECDLAVDGREAVEAFIMAFDDQRPYDLVLLDIMMPEMNGQDALKSIRAYEQEKGVAGGSEAVVFMVSALDTETQVVEAFFKGHCTDYITKPINRDLLFAKLREYGKRLHLDQDNPS